MEDVAATGAVTAREQYGARGWVLHHNTDQWRGTAPINNANHGIWPVADTPLVSMAPERWSETMRVNLDAVFLSTRAALGLMQAGGRVVMIGSTAGQRGEAFHADYAATKGATELMGHSYSHLFGTPMTFFRFFTVYGPWGRPDMALFKFAKAMLAGEAIALRSMVINLSSALMPLAFGVAGAAVAAASS